MPDDLRPTATGRLGPALRALNTTPARLLLMALVLLLLALLFLGF